MKRNFRSYIFSGDKTSCSGCGACVQVCTHNALKMAADDEGFLYPFLDVEKCIRCGLCDMTCPIVGKDVANKDQEQHCYIATTKEEKYYKDSASIGICTMLTEYVLEQGGVVFGCYLDENNWTAYHIAIDDAIGVQKIRNSKYLQSNTKNTYTEVKTYLAEKRLVLYIGTPCQIAGLKAFLHKEYLNLITLDLICHGVFSPLFMPLEISYWEKLFNSKVCNFRFRSKRKYTHTNCGMVNFDIIRKSGKLTHVERHASASPTYHCFAYARDGNNYNLRLSCYKCPMRDIHRYGDITVGDPWKVKSQIRNMLAGNVLLQSVYSANTEKGLDVIKHIQSKLSYIEFANDELFCQEAVLPTNRHCPAKRSQIFENIGSSDYGHLIEAIFETDLEQNHRIFLRNYMTSRIKDWVKKLLTNCSVL